MKATFDLEQPFDYEDIADIEVNIDSDGVYISQDGYSGCQYQPKTAEELVDAFRDYICRKTEIADAYEKPTEKETASPKADHNKKSISRLLANKGFETAYHELTENGSVITYTKVREIDGTCVILENIRYGNEVWFVHMEDTAVLEIVRLDASDQQEQSSDLEKRLGDIGVSVSKECDLLAAKIWTTEDVKSVLMAGGYLPTEENVALVVNSLDVDALADCTEVEWDALFTAVYANKNALKSA